MSNVLAYLVRMIPAAILALAVYGLAWPVRRRRLFRLGMTTTPLHEGGLVVFMMFLAGLLWLTVFPKITWAEGRLIFQEEGIGGVNLKPFVIFRQSRILARQGVKSYFLINFWGNILMFVPIGFFPALLWREGRWWKSVLFGFLLSMTIELCQIPISRGTDIDDLWLNTLGAAAGYALYALTRRGFEGFVERCKAQGGKP